MNKIRILKTSICITVFLGIIFFITLIIFEQQPLDSASRDLSEKIAIIMLVLSIISCIIMVYLLYKMKIPDIKVEPKVLKLKKTQYEDFKKIFKQKLTDSDYTVSNYSNSESLKIDYALKESKSEAYLVVLIKVAEYNEKEVDIKVNALYEHLNQISTPKNVRNTFYIVCTEKNTEDFKEYIYRSARLSYMLYNVMVGVSFEEKALYINDYVGLFKREHKKLVKEFMKYSDELVYSDVEENK
jgi:hypothetical protein